MPSLLLLTLHPPLTHTPQLHTVPNLYPLRITPKSPPSSIISIPNKSHVCFSIINKNSNNFDREESRWLREEQRWLREEQRWLREEQRWLRHEQSLLNQISDLKLQIQELERRNSSIQGVPDTVSNISTLLQLLKKEGDLGKGLSQIAESGSSSVPFEVEAKEAAGETEDVVVEEEVVVKGVIRVSENEVREVEKKRVTLRKGAEGDEVREMQEALEKLGYYSGEEDMEYAMFSSGTERAVKTWQATFGVPENGIMTSELLERLFVEVNDGTSGLQLKVDAKGNDGTAKDGSNGAAFASLLGASEVAQRVTKEEGVTEIDPSHHQVFLLGENRWEDSSRLTSKNKQVGLGMNTTKCIPCRGEGRLLCLECDGTGEPNIEEQFMEWVEEGMKCPYCEGLGYIVCDACEGKPLISK